MPQSVRRYLPLLLALLCLATVIPGFFLSFEDSEIWGITSSRRLIENPFVSSSAHYKPLFSLLFGAVVSMASSDWSALVGARWLAMIFAAGGLFSLYSFTVDRLDPDRRVSTTVLGYAIVSTMPLMMAHYSKARSDEVSASIVLIGMFVLARVEPKRLYLKGLTYLGTSLAALLVTPKSIDLLVVLAALFWLTSATSPRRHRWLWITGPIVIPLSAGLIFTREFMVKSLVYWFDTYEGVNLFSKLSWISFIRAAETAPIVSMLIAAGFIAGLVRFRQLSRNEKFMTLNGVIVSIFIILHSQKFFFFLASRIPFLALAAMPGLHRMTEAALRYVDTRTVPRGLIALFFVSLTISVTRLANYLVLNKISSEPSTKHFLTISIARARTDIGTASDFSQCETKSFTTPRPGTVRIRKC